VRSLRDGEVHANLLTIQLHTIHGVTGLGSVINALEVDECKSSAFAAESIHDDLDLLHGSELTELLVQVPLRGVQAQPEHAQTLGGLGIFPVRSVSPATIRRAATTTWRRGAGGRAVTGRGGPRSGGPVALGGRRPGGGGTVPAGRRGTTARGGGTGTWALITSTLVAFARVGARAGSPGRRGARPASRRHRLLLDLINTMVSELSMENPI